MADRCTLHRNLGRGAPATTPERHPAVHERVRMTRPVGSELEERSPMGELCLAQPVRSSCIQKTHRWR